MTWPWSDDVIRPLYVLTYVEPYRPFALIFAGNECFSCTQRTAEGKDFELILTLKMETRHPAAVSFRHCNHCRVMTVWPELARPGIFRSNFYFFEKNGPLWENFHSSVSIVFTASGSTLLCWNVVKFSGREMAEIVRYLQDKKKRNFGSLSNCLYCANRAQSLPKPAPTFGSQITMFQISSKSVHFRRSYSPTRESRSFGPQSKSMIRPKAFGRIINHKG